ncbi:NADPH-dependent FMN reductase [Labedaea rhizosphaerae]|uniref:NAD(P)H-dependent FMN reductase n=1 Tax=Labedaea rhizosphaerae TaxID=598644 RepID=A0A4R6SAG7_LABRH|nr:NAD(P)H-dependent oxidoreductase [Labedaea rhizosphaerae]TDP96503.1 NAD(P)H-dependent FMN reductase [Labedaea rhizosphaerae]
MSKLQIIIASTRPGRIGPKVAAWIEQSAKEHAGFDEVELVDLAAENLPMMDEPHHPRLRQYQNQHTKDWSAKVASADAYVFVMPEYNYGFTAPLKNAIDYLHVEWAYKPVGLVTYGGVSAGTRAAQMIKQVVTTLKMVPVPEAVSIPFVHSMINEDDELEPNDVMRSAAKGMFDELRRVSDALAPLRAQ